jgi:hypothetical protein
VKYCDNELLLRMIRIDDFPHGFLFSSICSENDRIHKDGRLQILIV